MESFIVFCSPDTITQLFISGLLPPYRKLMSIPMRGASWKSLKKDTELEKSVKDRIMACWHFEALLKDHYFGKYFPFSFS